MATAPPRDDAALLERLRQRDRTAWESVYATHQERLYRFAYRLAGNQHDAADLVQETFVRALPRLDSLPPDRADIGAYLFATTKNLFFKQVERGKRAQPVDEVPEPDEPAHIEDDPQRAALLRGQQREVRLANAKLAPRQRLVLALRELEDKSYAEIGELVGLNENAVAQLISRARQSLREELRLVQVYRSKLPEACQGYLPSLSALLDDQLKGAKRDEVMAHLEVCDLCQAALADMREASRRYRAIVPPAALGVALKGDIEEALAANRYWEPGVARRLGRFAARRRKSVAVAVTGLALLGVAGGGAAYLVTGESGDGDLVAAATAEVESAGPSAAATTVAPTAGATEAAVPTETVAVESVAGAATTEAATTDAATTGQVETSTTSEIGEGETDPAIATPPAETTDPPADPEPPVADPPAQEADTEPPDVSLGGGPRDPTPATSARFTFSADEPASFRCSLDGAAFSSCRSPKRYSGLRLGGHTFSVYAVDEAGNRSPSKSFSWTIEPPPDTEPPSVAISRGPASPTTATRAAFRFAASEPATFECQLDGSAFAACSSPASYSGLAPGEHTFAVRATDRAGNRSAPTRYRWVIDTPALPDLVISGIRPGEVVVANSGTAAAGPFVVRVAPGGSFTVAGLAPGASVRIRIPCTAGTVRAVADAGAHVAESNEGNNTLAFEISSCP